LLIAPVTVPMGLEAVEVGASEGFVSVGELPLPSGVVELLDPGPAAVGAGVAMPT
jgi:hypothetical protein